MSEAKEMVKKEDNVRMVLLPPCTVAAYQYIGENPEEKVGDDMEVPEPLVKKHFNGGLYAAYTIKFPDFFEWKFLTEWVEKSELYEAWISLQAQPAEMQKQVIDIMLDGIIEQIL